MTAHCRDACYLADLSGSERIPAKILPPLGPPPLFYLHSKPPSQVFRGPRGGMLLILWDWECCDAAAGRGSVLVLVGGEEGRPLGGRLAPTPCPDRSSDDDRSPRLSERRTPICRGRPAPPVSGPAAGALRSLVARRGPRTRTLERHQVRATQATQAPNSLVSSWINAGYKELGLFGSPVARKFSLPR